MNGLERARRESGLHQDEMAKLMGISISTYQKFERKCPCQVRIESIGNVYPHLNRKGQHELLQFVLEGIGYKK